MHRSIVITAAAAIAFAAPMTVATLASADTGDKVCAGLSSGKIDTTGDPDTVTITADPGFLISRYCVKAGSVNNGYGPVYIDVDPAVASLTISYPGGKAISNYSFEVVPIVVTSPTPTPTQYSPSPTPSETESSSPSPTPSETESSSPSPTPSETQSSSPSPTPSETESSSPSPTPSETESSSPSPTPSESESPSPSPSASESSSPTPSKSESPSLPPTDSSTVSPSPDQTYVASSQRLAQTGAESTRILGWAMLLVTFGALLVLGKAFLDRRAGAHK